MSPSEILFREIAYLGVCYLEEKTAKVIDLDKAVENKPSTSSELKGKIQNLAEFYRVPIKPRKMRPPFMEAFKSFLSNKNGYVETLPTLFNSIT